MNARDWWNLGLTLLVIAAVLLIADGCTRRVPEYDAASGSCKTGFGFIAKAKSEEHCNELQAVEDESEQVWRDAGLIPSDGGLGNARFFNGVVIAIPDNSDGGSWPNESYDGGPGQFRDLYGDSKLACPQIIGIRRMLLLAHDRWKEGPFCHEGTHILRACAPMDHLRVTVKTELPDGGVKVEQLWTGWFIDNRIDAKCGEAMKRVP